jgi:hypothetical protein
LLLFAAAILRIIRTLGEGQLSLVVRRMNEMMRVVLWLVLTLAGFGVAVSVWLFACSLEPTPGANMVLMGLPMVAFPTAICAATAIGIASIPGIRLSNWERRGSWVAGGLAAAVFGALFILG